MRLSRLLTLEQHGEFISKLSQSQDIINDAVSCLTEFPSRNNVSAQQGCLTGLSNITLFTVSRIAEMWMTTALFQRHSRVDSHVKGRTTEIVVTFRKHGISWSYRQGKELLVRDAEAHEWLVLDVRGLGVDGCRFDLTTDARLIRHSTYLGADIWFMHDPRSQR